MNFLTYTYILVPNVGQFVLVRAFGFTRVQAGFYFFSLQEDRDTYLKDLKTLDIQMSKKKGKPTRKILLSKEKSDLWYQYSLQDKILLPKHHYLFTSQKSCSPDSIKNQSWLWSGSMALSFSKSKYVVKRKNHGFCFMSEEPSGNSFAFLGAWKKWYFLTLLSSMELFD